MSNSPISTRASAPSLSSPGRRILLTAGLLALLLAACKGGDDADAAAGWGGGEMKSDSAILVEAVEAQTGVPFAVQGDYAGEFVADRMAEMAFEVSGRIVTLSHDVGDRIEKGEVMAAIDQTSFRQRVREASAAVKMAEASLGEAEVALENMEADMQRRRPLLDRELISEREIEDLDAQLRQGAQKVQVAQASLEQSQARLQTAREDLKNTEIRAPFDARVAARDVDLGSYVGPSQPAFSLVSDTGLYLRISIPEQDAAHIAVDKPVTVRVGALGGDKFEGKVVRVAPSLDRATRMMRTDIQLEADDDDEQLFERLRPGMYAHVQVELGRRDDAVTIPRQVLLEERSRAPFVWTVRDDEAKRQQVVLGLQGRERVEVVDGLSGGELVVIRGADGLTDGAKVRLLDAQPQPTGDEDSAESSTQGESP